MHWAVIHLIERRGRGGRPRRSLWMATLILMALLTACSLLFPSGATGPTTWMKVVATSGGGLQSLNVLPSGLILLPGGRPDGLQLTALDTEGSILWQKTYQDGVEAGNISVLPTRDGGYAAAAELIPRIPSEKSRIWVLRFDHSGAVQWSRSYTGPTYEFPQTLVERAGGAFAGAGLSVDPATGQASIWWATFDSSTAEVQGKSYPVPRLEPFSTFSQRTRAGEILLGGRLLTGSSGNPVSAFIGLADTAGQFRWTGSFQGSFQSVAVSGFDDPLGGYVTGGIVLLPPDPNKFGSTYSPWVLHLGGTGAPTGQQIYLTPFSSLLLKLVRTSDGGSLAAVVRAGDSRSDFFLLKLAASGSVQWMKQYETPGATSQLSDMAEAPGGGFLLLGTTRPQISSSSYTWLLKTRLDGSIPGNCPITVQEITGTTVQSGTTDFQPVTIASEDVTFTATEIHPTVSDAGISLQTHCEE